MSIRVKTSLCTLATILKDGETDGKATNRYLSCSASVLSLLVIFVGGNFREKAPGIKFRGFKFRGMMVGNMNFNL